MSLNTEVVTNTNLPSPVETSLNLIMAEIDGEIVNVLDNLDHLQDNVIVSDLKERHKHRDRTLIIAWIIACAIGAYATGSEVLNPDKIGIYLGSESGTIKLFIQFLLFVFFTTSVEITALLHSDIRERFYRRKSKQNTYFEDNQAYFAKLAESQVTEEIPDIHLLGLYTLWTNSSKELTISNPELASRIIHILTVNQSRLELLGFNFIHDSENQVAN